MPEGPSLPEWFGRSFPARSSPSAWVEEGWVAGSFDGVLPPGLLVLSGGLAPSLGLLPGLLGCGCSAGGVLPDWLPSCWVPVSVPAGAVCVGC